MNPLYQIQVIVSPCCFCHKYHLVHLKAYNSCHDFSMSFINPLDYLFKLQFVSVDLEGYSVIHICFSSKFKVSCL